MAPNSLKRGAPKAGWTHLTVLREKDGYSKTELAAMAGISISYLCDLERGHRKPTPALVAKFAQILNVPKSMLEVDRRADRVA